MRIAGTGHRPSKLGGYSPGLQDKLIALAKNYLSTLPEPCDHMIITGMALGWDQALAVAAIHLGFPLTCVIPFKGQEKVWPLNEQEQYHKILEHAHTAITLAEEFSVKAMYDRNIWMVDHSDRMVALYDGSGGGTAHCLRYAQSKSIPIDNLWEKYNA